MDITKEKIYETMWDIILDARDWGSEISAAQEFYNFIDGAVSFGEKLLKKIDNEKCEALEKNS